MDLPGGPVAKFVVYRSARRKRSISIQVREGGDIVVRAPLGIRTPQVLDVLAARAGWIEKKLAFMASLPVRVPVSDLVTVPVLGAPVPVVAGVPLVEGARNFITREPSRGVDPEARLIAWYRVAAEGYLPARVAHLERIAGAAPARVVVSRQRRAWGSCSRDGVIRLSWRLMMLPPHLIDAVVVHELCHLLHHDHGPQFWAEVERVLPGSRTHQAELRIIGRTLPL